MRAEVGVLSRNVKVQGSNNEQWNDEEREDERKERRRCEEYEDEWRDAQSLVSFQREGNVE